MRCYTCLPTPWNRWNICADFSCTPFCICKEWGQCVC